MESADSSSGTQQQPHLPPGYRFHPTDEELVVHYLKRKISSVPLPVAIIAEIDLYKFDPWELPAKATFGEHEWYFFSPRDRKYPNGARPNRAATSGYWKATGTDKPILTGGGTQKIAVKKALVFYSGKPPKGIKTNWIMHEYRLLDNNTGVMKPPVTKKNSSRLDDWVLCRIYKKNNSQRSIECDSKEVSMESSVLTPPSQQQQQHSGFSVENNETFYEELLPDYTNNLGSSCSRPSDVLMVPGMTRSPYWTSTSGTSHQSNSVANMLNQIPQQSSSSYLLSLGDGVYRQHYSGINWNS